MKWIYRTEDITALEGTVPAETIGYLRERFNELEEVYQDGSTPFTLGEYGGIALVDSFDEISQLIFEDSLLEEHQGKQFFRCVHVPNNDTCVDYCVPVSTLTNKQVKDLLENNTPSAYLFAIG